ncbi:P-II family nitrogen regulator [Deferrisoma sp.]
MANELHYKRRKLLTIVTEASIERKVTADALRLGAKGYTVCEASGQGHRGVRQGDWEANRNVRIEIVCAEQVARSIIDHLVQTYYDDYAMIVFLSDVEVIRPDKF